MLATSAKTPGVFFTVSLGSAPSGAADAPITFLLLGNKITSAITLSSPSFTSIAAGTQADETPVQLAGADDAASRFGRGSEVHRDAKALFAAYPTANVTGCTTAEASGGAAAAGVLTFATSASAAYSIRLIVCGQVIDVAIPSGTTATNIAVAVATAILNNPDLPVYAQNSSGAVTITAKHVGTRGNDLLVSAYFVPSTGSPVLITTSSTSSGAGTTGIFSSVGSALGSSYPLAAGSGDDSMTLALAAVAGVRYSRYVLAHRVSSQLTAVVAQLNSMAGLPAQKRQQAVAVSPGTLAAAATLAAAQNAPRLELGWHYATPTPAEEACAWLAGVRANGDAAAGGDLPGEAFDPAANLDGLDMPGVLAQLDVAYRPTDAQIETALNEGLTPLVPSVAVPGAVSVSRPMTTRFKDGSGALNYSVADTAEVTVPDFVADDMKAYLYSTFRGFKLVAEIPNNGPLTIPRTTTAKGVRKAIRARLKKLEGDGIIQTVDADDSLLTVVYGPSPGRLDAQIPCRTAKGLHIITGAVVQL